MSTYLRVLSECYLIHTKMTELTLVLLLAN